MVFPVVSCVPMNLVSLFISADTLQEFLLDDFNVQEHTNQVMQSMAITEQLSKLAEGISLLDKELHAQVWNE